MNRINSILFMFFDRLKRFQRETNSEKRQINRDTSIRPKGHRKSLILFPFCTKVHWVPAAFHEAPLVRGYRDMG